MKKALLYQILVYTIHGKTKNEKAAEATCDLIVNKLIKLQTSQKNQLIVMKIC